MEPLEYTSKEIELVLSQNNNLLPREIVRDLESALEEGRGVSMPVLTSSETIRMLDLSTLQYKELSPVDKQRQDAYLTEQTRIAKFNSPEEVAKRKKENHEFWKGYAIRARILTMRDWQKENKDSRTNELWAVELIGREHFIRRMKAEGHDLYTDEVEIAGAKAVFAYIETKYPDLYTFTQKSLSFWEKDSI